MYKKFLLAIGLVILFFAALKENNAQASSPYINWSVPARVPGYPPGTESPYLVADQNRVVHAFHSQPVNGKVSVVYSKWDYDHGWTMPVDILLPPGGGEAHVKGVQLDGNGIFHLLFASGDQFGGNVYYSRAPASDAGNAKSWSTPMLVGKNSNMFAAAMAFDDRGMMHVFYGGNLIGVGLYQTYSQDGGETWAEPVAVYLTNEDGVIPGDVTLLMDENDELHIAWSNWKPPFGALELYYARLNVNSNQMTIPELLYGNGADSPAMIKYQDTLLLVYATSGIATGRAGKAMQQSIDGGRNWTNAIWAFPPIFGGNGGTSLVSDSNNNLYALFGNRAGDCCHGLWYTSWEGNRWSRPRSIIQGPKAPEFDPFSPEAVISQGNIILVTWWNESKINGVWYSYARLDTPETPPIPYPTFMPSPSLIVSTSPSSDTLVNPLSPTRPVKTILPDSPLTSYQQPSSVAFVIGVVPVLILIILVVLGRKRN